MSGLAITPETKVGELPEACPELEAPLVDAMRKKGFETASFRVAGGRVATLLRLP